MIRAAGRALALTAAFAAGIASAQPGGGMREGRGGGMPMGFADPAGIIAAEIAIGQLAVEKGQWSALSRMAAKDAVLLVPQPVAAQRWLKAQAPVAVSARLNTHLVFLSCDGSTALSTGTWSRRDGAKGWYRAVWRRDPKKGGFKWLVGAAGPLASASDEPEAISARVARCQRRDRRAEDAKAPLPLAIGQPLPADYEARSEDGSLRWRWSPRGLEGWMVVETGEEQVLANR